MGVTIQVHFVEKSFQLIKQWVLEGGNNAAALLQGLGALVSTMSQTGKEEDSNPAANILQSLSSVLGQNRGGGLFLNCLKS